MNARCYHCSPRVASVLPSELVKQGWQVVIRRHGQIVVHVPATDVVDLPYILSASDHKGGVAIYAYADSCPRVRDDDAGQVCLDLVFSDSVISFWPLRMFQDIVNVLQGRHVASHQLAIQVDQLLFDTFPTECKRFI